MVRPRSEGLTNHELKIMKIFWDSGSNTVRGIVDAIDLEPTPAYSSILTAIRALKQKGYLSHEQKGKAFVYSAQISKGKVLKGNLKRIATQFFDGSAFDLAVNLVKSEKLSDDERKRLQQILKEQ